MDVQHFDFIAETVFAPIYPVIADDILARTGINHGTCIDLGAGTGKLGLAVADLNKDMDVVLYDILPEILVLAAKYIGNRARVKTMEGAVEKLPFADDSVDLAVSRGSVYFWEDKVEAFREIYRVLKSGGYAYIGGGFGTTALRQQIEEKMKKAEPDWMESKRKRNAAYTPDYFKDILEKAGIPHAEIVKEEAGLWILFQK